MIPLQCRPFVFGLKTTRCLTEKLSRIPKAWRMLGVEITSSIFFDFGLKIFLFEGTLEVVCLGLTLKFVSFLTCSWRYESVTDTIGIHTTSRTSGFCWTADCLAKWRSVTTVRETLGSNMRHGMWTWSVHAEFSARSHRAARTFRSASNVTLPADKEK